MLMTGRAPVYVLVWPSLQQAKTGRGRAGQDKPWDEGWFNSQKGCLGTRHGSHMGSGRALWIGLYLSRMHSPSLTKIKQGGPDHAQTDRKQRHTATTTSPRCQGSMGGCEWCRRGTVAGQKSLPCPSPDCVCFDWRRGSLPTIYHHSISGEK